MYVVKAIWHTHHPVITALIISLSVFVIQKYIYHIFKAPRGHTYCTYFWFKLAAHHHVSPHVEFAWSLRINFMRQMNMHFHNSTGNLTSEEASYLIVVHISHDPASSNYCQNYACPPIAP